MMIAAPTFVTYVGLIYLNPGFDILFKVGFGIMYLSTLMLSLTHLYLCSLTDPGIIPRNSGANM